GFLLGDDTPDAAIGDLLVNRLPQRGEGSALARALGDQVRLAYVQEELAADASALAGGALRAVGLGAVTVDLRRRQRAGGLLPLAPLLAREALLMQAGLVVGPLEALAEHG